MTETVPHIGEKLRAARRAQQLSLRELAERAEVSPSMLSKIENGKANPSVRTLHSLSEALSVPVHRLFSEKTETKLDMTMANALSEMTASEFRVAEDNEVFSSKEPGFDDLTRQLQGPVVKGNARSTIELQGGVTWSRLTPDQEEGAEFLQISYEPGGNSGQRMSHHAGREFHYILHGEMLLELGFEQYVLKAGDSIVFDSNTPHRLSNPGQAPLSAISVIFNK